jgi:hypothetical protein
MEQVTNDKGVACFDELAWGGEGTEYTVRETVPEGMSSMVATTRL